MDEAVFSHTTLTDSAWLRGHERSGPTNPRSMKGQERPEGWQEQLEPHDDPTPTSGSVGPVRKGPRLTIPSRRIWHFAPVVVILAAPAIRGAPASGAPPVTTDLRCNVPSFSRSAKA
jgi:hypothetical protein